MAGYRDPVEGRLDRFEKLLEAKPSESRSPRRESRRQRAMSADTSRTGGSHEPMVFSQRSELENWVSRIFRVPLKKVFRLFIDPAPLPYVFSPGPGLVPGERHEFREGGRCSILVKLGDGPSIRFQGEYREVEPTRRAVNSLEVDGVPARSAVETDEFDLVGPPTRVTARWKFLRSEERAKTDRAAGEQARTTIWGSVAGLLEQASPELAEAGA
jgi:uncharacterized protein YndB with AHSA1/START domain